MKNAILKYHTTTSYDRHQMPGHYLDWQNQPSVFKTYSGIDPIRLSREVGFPDIKLSSLLRETLAKNSEREIRVNALSRILLLTYSLTAKASHQGTDFYYRSAASAGALYPTEIYLAARGLRDLENGLYHFSIAEHALHPLRKGDFSKPFLTFFLSAIFYRSAWKYRDRAYRYHLLDTGHVLENLLLALKASGIEYKPTYDFNDRSVNRMLGVDEDREACLAICRLSGVRDASDSEASTTPELPDAIKQASRTAERETDYPPIVKIHRAGSETILRKENISKMIETLGPAPENWKVLHLSGSWPEFLDYPDTIFRRRSKRNFVPRPLARNALDALMSALCLPQSTSRGTVCAGLLQNRAEGMEPGIYLLDREQPALGLIVRGLFGEYMAHICLDQAWLANAAVHFLFMANLAELEAGWGPRGYRYAMLEAGRMGERLYLAATSMGLGCCGIGAFYDGEAAQLLELNETSRLLYLVAVGPVKS